MLNNLILSVKESILPSFDEQKDVWLKSSYTLRRLVGTLGILLPLLLPLQLLVTDHYQEVLESISHYYFTKSGPLFIAIMSLLAIFLIIYKETMTDFIISSVAGFFALCVVLFPTDSLIKSCVVEADRYIVTVLPIDEFRQNFHYISASIFLGCLAYISLFLFTKNQPDSNEDNERALHLRRRLYRIFGVCMLVAMIGILLGSRFVNFGFLAAYKEMYNDYHLTFWFETIAVESFGFSWLAKGTEYKLNTKKQKS